MMNDNPAEFYSSKNFYEFNVEQCRDNITSRKRIVATLTAEPFDFA